MPRRPRVRGVSVSLPVALPDVGELVAPYTEAVATDKLRLFAAELGVSPESLRQLRIGWDGEAFTFPMVNADGTVIGIRRRLPDGRKLSVKGGHEGLFAPHSLSTAGLLLVAEGPTDCAALLTLGLAAVGRPSCRGGLHALSAFVRGRDVAIVADGDGPGRAGARAAATALAVLCPTVRVIHPPGGARDARDWVNNGATRLDVLGAVHRVEPERLGVRTVAV